MADQLQALADRLNADPGKNVAGAAKLMQALDSDDEVRRTGLEGEIKVAFV